MPLKRIARTPAWIWDWLPARFRILDLGRRITSPRPSPLQTSTLTRQPIPPADPRTKAPAAGAARPRACQRKYDDLVNEMKQQFGIRIHRWRLRTSGCAWEVHYADGSVTKLIESPYPRGPMSAAVFLHEVGHHAIGFHRYKLRCMEEYMAWKWALEAMRRNRITVSPTVLKRVDRAMRYAVRKAVRRGICRLPDELQPYL